MDKKELQSLIDRISLTGPEGTKKIKKVLKELSDGTSSDTEKDKTGKYIEIEYSALKNLRDSGNLKPGSFYHITDYECTTSQENTKSAGHRFDIIVQATSENTLSEDAKAIQHKGIDETAKGKYTRYDSSNIEFVEYITMDNITYAKYEGTGVLDSVSHIISVLFEVNNVIFNEFDVVSNKYYFVPQFIKIDSEQYHAADSDADVVSFNDDIRGYFYDSNLAAWELKYCIDNDEDRFLWADTENGKGVIYKMIDEYNNECPYDFKNIMFYRTGSTIRKIYNYFDVDNNIYLYTFSWIGDGYISDSSILGQTLESDEGAREGVFGNIIKECSTIRLGYYDKHEFCFALPNNVIISHFEYDGGYFYGCIGNIFECDCISNTFGDNCSYNKLGSGSSDNIFGTNCKNNNFNCLCSYNNFGKDCSNNIFGNNCTNNVFGNNCSRNIFGNSCYYNELLDDCSVNTLENNCYENEFGHDFDNVILENGCNSIRFGSTSLAHYCENIKISAGCEHLRIYSNDDINARANNKLMNIYIAQGIKGTYAQPVSISIPGRNLEYETKVAKDSHRDLQIYCEADLVN